MISRVRFSNCMFFFYTYILLYVCTGRTALCQRRAHSFCNQTSSSFDKVIIIIIITEYILYHLFFIFITFQLYRYRRTVLRYIVQTCAVCDTCAACATVCYKTTNIGTLYNIINLYILIEHRISLIHRLKWNLTLPAI